MGIQQKSLPIGTLVIARVLDHAKKTAFRLKAVQGRLVFYNWLWDKSSFILTESEEEGYQLLRTAYPVASPAEENMAIQVLETQVLAYEFASHGFPRGSKQLGLVREETSGNCTMGEFRETAATFESQELLSSMGDHLGEREFAEVGRPPDLDVAPKARMVEPRE
eukprot:5446028-Amphidinium_carterae.1